MIQRDWLPVKSDSRIPRHHMAQSGFSLIELAVVVVVIALLLGSLLVPLTTQVEQRKVAEAQKTLDEIRDALMGYAMANNGRLPRPAISLTNGTQRGVCDGSSIPGPGPLVDKRKQECTGFLPWTVLGVPRSDPWGKMFKYSVSPDLADDTITMSLSSTGQWDVYLDSTAATPVAQNVAAVVMSHGPKNHGTTESGAAVADLSGTNVDEDSNAQANLTRYYARGSTSNPTAPGGEFDDVVVWIPTSLFIGRMVTAGRLP